MRISLRTPANGFAILVLMGTAAGCSRLPRLAEGPIDLSQRPTVVRFVQPVTSSGQTWELCFEFDRPGDSHRAATIHATLMTSSGDRAPLRAPTLDRKGESTVCQIGPVGPTTSDARTVYESVELDSEAPLRLRGIRGGRRP
jgi:hypothetical protein